MKRSQTGHLIVGNWRPMSRNLSALNFGTYSVTLSGLYIGGKRAPAMFPAMFGMRRKVNCVLSSEGEIVGRTLRQTLGHYVRPSDKQTTGSRQIPLVYVKTDRPTHIHTDRHTYNPSVRMSGRPSVRMSVGPSEWLSDFTSVSTSVGPSERLSDCTSICTSVGPSDITSDCL